MKKWMKFVLVIAVISVIFVAGCKDDVTEPENVAPIANAGADQTVLPGALVTLDGSYSSDLENDELTYYWTSVDTSIVLSAVNIVNPTFTASVVAVDTDYIFQLIVNDGESESEVDEVIITVSEVVPTFNILTEYLDANGMTITDLTTDWITAASGIVDNLDDYYIMDIRTGDYHGATVLDDPDDIVDYDNGHIEGAVLSSLGTIVTDAALADKPIIVVCYSGQSAGHAVMALRLSGYSNAMVLKWGMSGWNSAFDVWSGNTAQLNHANWEAAPGAIADAEVFDYPEIDTDLEDGAGILAERVAALLDGGFMSVASVDVLDMPTEYFINNYWDATDVETYGNIDGAYRIKPLVLENLDPAGTVVTYCWTGQTSSLVTAYLTVLGYDAKSLKYGVNSIIYDDLTDNNWVESMDYTYETGE